MKKIIFEYLLQINLLSIYIKRYKVSNIFKIKCYKFFYYLVIRLFIFICFSLILNIIDILIIVSDNHIY